MNKKIYALLIATFMLFSSLIAVTATETTAQTLVDDYDALSSLEEQEIEMRIQQIKDIYNFDVTIIITDTVSASGMTTEQYADNYPYIIEENDGVVFLHDPYLREYMTSARNNGMLAFNDYSFDQIDDKVVPFLKDDDFYGAYMVFLSLTEDFLSSTVSGEEYKPAFHIEPMAIFGGLFGAVAISAISVMIMKRSMNTAVHNRTANNYIESGSLNLTIQNDRFLFENTIKTPKPKNNSGGSRGGGGGGGRSSRGGSY